MLKQLIFNAYPYIVLTPFNGLQSDLIKYFSNPYKKIPENIGAELDKITEIEVHVSSSKGTTVKCVSALLGTEMSFF